MQPEQGNNFWQPDAQDAPATLPPVPAPVVENQSAPPPNPLDDDHPIVWQASESIHHEKDGRWFMAVAGIALVLLVIDIFLIRSWTFGALILVMAVAAVVVARRPPRMVNYALSRQGIRIDDKLFSFHDFRAFGVIQEGAMYSVRLIPNKRFMPLVSVYFPAEQGEQIVDIFGGVLPMENIEPDAMDRLIEKMRF